MIQDKQVIPVSPSTMAIRRDRGKAPYELVFIATAPPLGYNTYFVRLASTLLILHSQKFLQHEIFTAER